MVELICNYLVLKLKVVGYGYVWAVFILLYLKHNNEKYKISQRRILTN